jgi:hypothetical protein
MRFTLNARWTVLIVLNVLFGCVLCFDRGGQAAPAEPFANATAQRAEMLATLKEINAQLKEQNALLASGKLQVIAATGKDQPPGGQ